MFIRYIYTLLSKNICFTNNNFKLILFRNYNIMILYDLAFILCKNPGLLHNNFVFFSTQHRSCSNIVSAYSKGGIIFISRDFSQLPTARFSACFIIRMFRQIQADKSEQEKRSKIRIRDQTKVL